MAVVKHSQLCLVAFALVLSPDFSSPMSDKHWWRWITKALGLHWSWYVAADCLAAPMASLLHGWVHLKNMKECGMHTLWTSFILLVYCPAESFSGALWCFTIKQSSPLTYSLVFLSLWRMEPWILWPLTWGSFSCGEVVSWFLSSFYFSDRWIGLVSAQISNKTKPFCLLWRAGRIITAFSFKF